MFPSEDTITSIFSSQHPLQRKMQPHPEPLSAAKRQPFPAWSVVEETKKKSDAIATEAAREFDIASQKAQSKTGKIEPWSGKYYAACTFGGLLACVRLIHTVYLAIIG